MFIGLLICRRRRCCIALGRLSSRSKKISLVTSIPPQVLVYSRWNEAKHTASTNRNETTRIKCSNRFIPGISFALTETHFFCFPFTLFYDPPPSPVSCLTLRVSFQAGGAPGADHPTASTVGRMCWELLGSARRLCAHGEGAALSSEAVCLLSERLVSVRERSECLFSALPPMIFTLAIIHD